MTATAPLTVPTTLSSETLPPPSEPARRLMTELQSYGLRLLDPGAGVASRRGGAGPSDHKAVTVDGHTIMVPVHTGSAFHSPFVADAPDAQGRVALRRGSIPIASISFPKAPRRLARRRQRLGRRGRRHGHGCGEGHGRGSCSVRRRRGPRACGTRGWPGGR